MTQQSTKKKQQLAGPGTRGPHIDVEKGIARFAKLLTTGNTMIGEAECLLVRLMGAKAPVEKLIGARAPLGLAANSARFQIDSINDYEAGGTKEDGMGVTLSRMAALLDRSLATVKELERLRGVTEADALSLEAIEPIGAKLGNLETMCAELRESLFWVVLQPNGTPDLSRGGV